jgi:hypothetical protein
VAIVSQLSACFCLAMLPTTVCKLLLCRMTEWLQPCAYTGKHGTVYVTYMDQIEKSELSRQFLFRNTDINRPKSTTAVRAVTVMNPASTRWPTRARCVLVCIAC